MIRCFRCLLTWSLGLSFGWTALIACSPSAPPGQAQFSTDSLSTNGRNGGNGRDGIVGGSEATGHEAFSRMTAALLNVRENSLCTASILSSSILITAAHCLEGMRAEDFVVAFGLAVTRNKMVLRPVESFEAHPERPAEQMEVFNTRDLGLIRFYGGLPPGYVPARLLTSTRFLADGQETLLAGYGDSNGPERSGSGVLRSAVATIKKVDFTTTEILVDQSHGRGACHGDSGGPAYAMFNNQLYLFGVTSRGFNDPYNDCSVDAVFTSLSSYRMWIYRTAQKLNDQPSRFKGGAHEFNWLFANAF